MHSERMALILEIVGQKGEATVAVPPPTQTCRSRPPTGSRTTSPAPAVGTHWRGPAPV